MRLAGVTATDPADAAVFLPAAWQTLCAVGAAAELLAACIGTRDARQPPTAGQLRQILDQLGYDTPALLDGGHLWTHGLTEQQRYPIQHQLGFQVWDLDLPHFAHAHGRSLAGYQPGEQELADLAAARERVTTQARFDDD